MKLKSRARESLDYPRLLSSIVAASPRRTEEKANSCRPSQQKTAVDRDPSLIGNLNLHDGPGTGEAVLATLVFFLVYEGFNNLQLWVFGEKEDETAERIRSP
ncbi:hypothetical protein L484_006554 [Morus notabilis]|uniref:Uncharacterized protein n=1 Tax=Morus notabilis TaxID=981085 RepID=W9RX80_9ROSA|nr:hypothetical protein L484_006554 [Morus notabilis]